MINVAVCGIGRAGSEVVKEIRASDQLKLTAAFCRVNSEKAGKDVGSILKTGRTGVIATEVTHADRVLSEKPVNVFLDFSNPKAMKPLITACQKHGVPGVVCTTGFTDDEIKWMTKLADNQKIGIVYAPNVTLGINVLLALLKTVTHVLPSFDYQVTEIHHNKKTDRPSSTAKRIAETIRDGLDGKKPPEIPINSVRAGGYVGVHEVLVAGDNERISLTHETFARKAFAQGALRAAKFVIGKKGWYRMEDVIDIDAIIREDSIIRK